MNSRRLSISILTAILAAAGPGSAQSPSADETLARTLTLHLAAQRFSAVVAHFDPTMTSAMPAAKLAQVWDTITGQTGAFQSIGTVNAQTVQGYQVEIVTTQFAHATLGLKWVFDAQGRVAGFFAVPAETATAAWTPPAYADPAAFHEEPVTVGSAPWQLSGTLTLPNGSGPFPAIVLVAGSGPNDQDETVLANKPFKDLAWGLASRHIAVLRYNKRTRQYGKEIAANDSGFTVNQETVDDARSAVALLAANPTIDSHRIFVLGHSLGGMMAPRIALNDTRVAGLVILAGPTRPFEQVALDQVRYLAGLQAPITPEAQMQIDAAQQAADQIESPSLTPGTRVKFLGATIPGSYFLDLRNYHPAQVAAALQIPMLILRGARDYQVTAADMDGWQKALAGRHNVTFITYPGLFHLFMPSTSPGSGLGTPADYQKAQHVSQPVIDDIARWIVTHPRS
jgi:uncharacterized protein